MLVAKRGEFREEWYALCNLQVAALLGDDCLHHEEAFDSDLSCSPIGHPLHQHVDYHDGWRTRM